MYNQPLDETTNPDEPLSGLQILLVEDEVDIADLLLFILSEAGAKGAWVTHSQDALNLLHEINPHLLLSNVRLPDYDGDLLIQEIRRTNLSQRHYLPAIAITSHTREFSEQQMLDAGFERFLGKNFDAEELIRTIRELVE